MGFFAFRNPGPDRLLSNWMLAAERDNPILAALYDAYLRIWQTTYFSNQNNRFGKLALAKLSPILNKNAERTTWWTAPVIRKTIRVYPYFIFHYTFAKVILSDSELLRVWEASEGLDAGLPHRLQLLAEVPDGWERAVAEIAKGVGNVQKLNWRIDVASPYWTAVLTALARLLPHGNKEDSGKAPGAALSEQFVTCHYVPMDVRCARHLDHPCISSRVLHRYAHSCLVRQVLVAQHGRAVDLQKELEVPPADLAPRPLARFGRAY